MSDNTNSSTPAVPTTRDRDRRASFSPGQTLTNLFGRSPTRASPASGFSGPIATAAAANAQQRGRRMSISTLGLSGSPTQTSPFAPGASRRESMSSAGTASANTDESAIEDGDSPVTAPNSPLARRMSYGARALRDVRGGYGGGGNNANGMSSTSSHPSLANKHRGSVSSELILDLCSSLGEGFNWSESLRSRAQRASTVSAMPPNNAASVAAPAPTEVSASSATATVAPPRNMPKAAPVPDHFQERILKGDFYMD